MGMHRSRAKQAAATHDNPAALVYALGMRAPRMFSFTTAVEQDAEIGSCTVDAEAGNEGTARHSLRPQHGVQRPGCIALCRWG